MEIYSARVLHHVFHKRRFQRVRYGLCAAKSILRPVCRRIFPVFTFSRYIYCFRWEKIKQNGNFGKKFLNLFCNCTSSRPKVYVSVRRNLPFALRPALLVTGNGTTTNLLALTNFSAIALLKKRQEKKGAPCCPFVAIKRTTVRPRCCPSRLPFPHGTARLSAERSQFCAYFNDSAFFCAVVLRGKQPLRRLAQAASPLRPQATGQSLWCR